MVTTRRGAGRPKDESKRAAILEAAGKCFLKNGFSRTTMERIADEAGVSKLTLYSHFQNKDLLFQAMIAARCKAHAPPEGHLALAGKEPRAALMEIGTGFARLTVNPKVIALHRLVATESVKSPKLAELLYQAGPKPTLEGFSALLRVWKAKGVMDVSDPERAADHYFSLLRGMMEFRLSINIEKPPTDAELRRHVEGCVDLFLRAYGSAK